VSAGGRVHGVRPKKYPLDPLAQLRAKQVDDATRELAATVKAREEAERAEALARSERQRLAEESKAVRDAERAALERGELRASDLMNADAWALRAREEEAMAARREIEATKRTGAAKVGEEHARDRTAQRRADADVVERDRAKWEDRERRVTEAKAEEAAEEAWRRRG